MAALLLFAIPKPFVGHTGLIQRNAIRSWTHLRPKREILLFGNRSRQGQIAASPSLETLQRVRKAGYKGGKTALYALVASVRPKMSAKDVKRRQKQKLAYGFRLRIDGDGP